MTARRSPRTSRTCSAQPPVFESLEIRRLLATFYGGQSFTYKDARDNNFLVTLGGNIEAEFVFAITDDAEINFRPGNFVPGFVDDIRGRDLFSIYVTRSTPDAFISVVQIEEGGLAPFGEPADMRIIPASLADDGVIQGAPDSGSGYLGARTNGDGELADIPIVALGFPSVGFGVIPPQPGNFLRAGISVNNGFSFGRFIFDGTVTGFVNFTGSVGDFYCGNLFTGNSRGSFFGAPVAPYADNFNVLGDIRNVLVKGFVGTDETGTSEPVYLSGFDMQVRGTLGQFRALSHIAGKFDVRNVLAGPFLNRVQRETETKGLLTEPGSLLAGGFLGGDPFFENDTFENPQYLPSIPDAVFGGSPGVRVTGSIDPLSDTTDFYAVPLLAGQTIIVQVVTSAGETSSPLLGVFDPDGRLVASNYNDIAPSVTIGKPFQFTADRPGNYRFGVGTLSTVTEGLTTDPGFVAPSPYFGTYSMRVQFAGNTGIGAIVSNVGNYLDLGQEPGIKVWRGDFGALVLGDPLEGVDAGGEGEPTLVSTSTATIQVPFGNLRVVEGNNLGQEGGLATAGLNVFVPFGHVGLLQSTVGTLGVNLLQQNAVGGNFQVIDAATSLFGSVRTNRAIGIIRAGSVAGGMAIEVNADDTGRDGIISLIDVEGDFGDGVGGGPQISTNLGGNVGYLRVLGDVYRDFRFGSGLGTTGNTITVPAGRSYTITDDSGTLIDIAPRLTPNPNYNPNLPGSTPFLDSAPFTVTFFPIFGSGGSAVVNVVSSNSLVFSSNNPSRDRRLAEIGRVEFTAGGAPVILQSIFQPGTGTGPDNPGIVIDTRPVLDPTSTVDVSLYVVGPTPISILETTFGAGGTLAANLIQNTSGGDLPIVRASSIGNLYGSNMGTASTTIAGTALLPREILLDTYPFIGERVGVVTGNVINIGASQSIGNVSATGIVGAIFPNSDNIDLTNVFEGIVGSINAAELRFVDIGEGIAAGGSGYDNEAGLFSSGDIRVVTNRGRGDIRGPIASLTEINQIRLTNGSIINSNIGVLSTLSDVNDFHGLITVPTTNEPIDQPGYEMGPITLEGNGGIIGSLIVGADVDNIHVKQGFGIFTSIVGTPSVGRINRVIADGYGLRGVTIFGGGSLTEVNATGDGRQLNSESYTYQTRLSEFGYRIDPYFNIAPNILTDIHAVLGTTKDNRVIENVTNSGIIEDSSFRGGIEMNALYANRVRRSEFSFADRIELFQTRGPIRDVEMNTGQLRKMIIQGDVAESLINVAGPLFDLYITGSVDAATTVQAIGASGRIDRLQVLRFLAGDVRTTGILNVLAVGRDILSTSRIEADEIPTRYIGGQIFGQIVIT